MPYGFYVLACKIITALLIKDTVSKEYRIQLWADPGKNSLSFFRFYSQKGNKKRQQFTEYYHKCFICES